MTTALSLPPQIDLSATEQLALAIRAARHQPLILDAAHVSHVGALFSQLLWVSRAAWEADGQPFEIRNPSESFLDGLSLLGMSPEDLCGEAYA
ncbi:STAS domain-containing protein [Thioclava sp. BHET1]|nr:STAS domain-containing protein [Thioclava sp. BHET1]